MKTLLIVAHAPSKNTQLMVEAILKGAQHSDVEQVKTNWIPPLETTPEDVLACNAIILGTTGNLSYMSVGQIVSKGLQNDFFWIMSA